jgi:hypothetical protein
MPGFRFCGFGLGRGLRLGLLFGSPWASGTGKRSAPGLCFRFAGLASFVWPWSRPSARPSLRIALGVRYREAKRSRFVFPLCGFLVPARPGIGRGLRLGLFFGSPWASGTGKRSAPGLCFRSAGFWCQLVLALVEAFGSAFFSDRLGRLFPLHGNLPCSLPSEMPGKVFYRRFNRRSWEVTPFP